MLFNSFVFIFIFLPITFTLYFLLNKFKLAKLSLVFLALASLFFYAYWNVAYLALILCSMLFNYAFGAVLIGKFRLNLPRKAVLVTGIGLNLALLGYYKYADFFIKNINFVLNSDISTLNLLLPLAISFFTFQQISYLVDSYKGDVREYDFFNYALFVTFFPQLIAGPIVHHKEMMPQFADSALKRINYENLSRGLFIFVIGLFKKVVIADFFAKFATYGFDTASALTMSEAWLASLSYTFQLYFDFSGYSDMAIGLALMFNIKLPINFNSPYKALDVQDFWRRWHITLSRFLRDYVYIPLGGNRMGERRAYINVFIVFLLGGLWHGAGWTFVIWGAMHGAAQMVFRFYHAHFRPLNKILAWFITFNFINLTWIFFRAKSVDDALKVIGAMFDFSRILPSAEFNEFINASLSFYSFLDLRIYPYLPALILAAAICSAFMMAIFCKNSIQILERAKFGTMGALGTAMMIACVYFASLGVTQSPFLYFNF